MEATRVAVSRRAAILFCSISRAASRWMVRRVDTPKPTMSTTTMRSPIFSASGERNTEVASATRGPRDGLRQLVGLTRIERLQARVHRARVVETAHFDVRLTEVLERLRIVRPEPKGLGIRLHRLVPPPLLAQRIPEAIPGLGQRGIELDGVAVPALRGRPVAALGERAALVEARLCAHGAVVGYAQRRVVDSVRHCRHRQPREPEHQPAHRGDGSIWRVNPARLGDESIERFGEYTALHFEGRDLTNVARYKCPRECAFCRPFRKTRSGRFSGKSCEHWWDDGPAAHAAGPSRSDYLSLSSSILSARSSTASPTFRLDRKSVV